MFLKITQDSQENVTVWSVFLNSSQSLFLSLFHRYLPVKFTKFLRGSFYRTPPGDCFCSTSFNILFIGMCNICKVSLLITVHTFLLKLFSKEHLIFFGMFLTVREMIFRLMIFNTLSHYCYLSSWLPHF